MSKTVSLIAIVIALAIGFFGGMQYGKSSSPAAGERFGAGGQGFGGNRGAGGMRNGGGVTSGEVIGKDATSITVKMQDGSTKIVFVSGATQVMKAATGSLADVAVGVAVTAIGTTNNDGSVTAQSLQLRPAGTQVFGGRRASTTREQ